MSGRGITLPDTIKQHTIKFQKSNIKSFSAIEIKVWIIYKDIVMVVVGGTHNVGPRFNIANNLFRPMCN